MSHSVDFLYSRAPVEQRRITFVPAQHPEETPVPEGLNIVWLTPRQDNKDMAASVAERQQADGYRSKRQRTVEPEPVDLHWTEVYRTGPGLQNVANTCYMNSVLQCLTHTPPLAEALLSGQQWDPGDGLDPLYLTQQHVIKALRSRSGTISPLAHANTLRRVCNRFKKGRHEDAHEYLMNLLDVMHESMVKAAQKGQLPGSSPSASAQPTSLIHRIFGGRIRNQVKCTECGYESNRSDLFIDLSLEIDHASSISRALQRYVAPEYLDGANKYWCKRHRAKMRASKCMTIDAGPNVLILQLKRFAFAGFGAAGLGHKLHKKVDFETVLDLAPVMSNRRAGPQLYELYAVIVHVGHSLNAGHYYCFVRASNGLWHRMDDTHVSQVSERIVLAQHAYMLFYIRKAPPPAPSEPPSAAQPHAPATGAAPNSASSSDTILANGHAGSTHASAPHTPSSPPAQPLSSRPQPGTPPAKPAGPLANGSAHAKRKQPDAESSSPRQGDGASARPGPAGGAKLEAEASSPRGVAGLVAGARAPPPGRAVRQAAVAGDAVRLEDGHASDQSLPSARRLSRHRASVGDLRQLEVQSTHLDLTKGVRAQMGGRSWKRWQQHLRVHRMRQRLQHRPHASSDTPTASSDSGPLASVPLSEPPASRPSRLRPLTSVPLSEPPAPRPSRLRPLGPTYAQPDAESSPPPTNESPPLDDQALASTSSDDSEQRRGKSLQPHAGLEGDESGSAGEEGVIDDSPEVSAPDWPPFAAGPGSRELQPPASPRQQRQERRAAAQAVQAPEAAPPAASPAAAEHRSTDPAEVAAFLQMQSEAVGHWDEGGAATSNTPQLVTRSETRPGPCARRDDYDAEYDRGKQKKLRRRSAPGEELGGGVSGSIFQDAWEDRRSARGRGHGQHRGGRHRGGGGPGSGRHTRGSYGGRRARGGGFRGGRGSFRGRWGGRGRTP